MAMPRASSHDRKSHDVVQLPGSQKKEGKGGGEEGGNSGRVNRARREKRGKNEGKRVEERGPKKHSKNSDFGTPLI